MTNLEMIQTTTPELLAKFLHRTQAGAIIEGQADSEEILLEWLTEEADEDIGTD